MPEFAVAKLEDLVLISDEDILFPRQSSIYMARVAPRSSSNDGNNSMKFPVLSITSKELGIYASHSMLSDAWRNTGSVTHCCVRDHD